VNEQIKQLADEARFKRMGSSWAYRLSDEFEEEFAKLIVVQCIKMIENEASTYAEPVWAVELINDIKKHFGVPQ